MIRDVAVILGGVLLVAGGLFGGWWLRGDVEARQAVGGDAHGHGHGGGEADPHAGHDHGVEAAGTIDAAALRALGVVVQPIQLAPFTATEDIPAVVADRPENHRVVRLPFGGVVQEVHVQTGDHVLPETPLLTVVREAIPPFTRDRTGELLTPLGEEVHAAVGALREATTRLAIARRERERLATLTADGVVPAAQQRESLYEIERAERAVANAEHELEHHGLTDVEIDQVAAGTTPPPQPLLWERVLRRQGWWDEHADALRDLLPASRRDRAWVVPGLGELHAAGLLDEALVDDVRATPAMAAHLAEVIALLLSGTPRPTVTAWARDGLLEPTWALRVPCADCTPESGEAPGYDVEQLHVRAGDRVAAGQEAVSLYRGAAMWIRALPIGRQLASLTRALASGAKLGAVPLVAGTGPTFSGLSILRIHPRVDGGTERSVADLPVQNEAARVNGDTRARTWRLQAGLRYRVKVPTAAPVDAFVLPRTAIVREAGTTQVLLTDGPGFRRVPVRLLQENPREVAIAYDGSIFPGDDVVVDGAFALSLALQQAESGGGGGHAHHGHSH
ncbi:MAG: hypothetical protein AB7T63_04780 [Planctomycetota bacterium]